MSEVPKELEHASSDQALAEVSHFLDVPLKITIQLGNRNIKIREILQLKSDSVLELPKSAGESLEVYVNGKLVAFGEVLEMEGNAGIRLTDINHTS
jgi:flagellar motor switch protein FliN